MRDHIKSRIAGHRAPVSRAISALPLRAIALIAVAMFLILVLLPVGLVAAGA